VSQQRLWPHRTMADSGQKSGMNYREAKSASDRNRAARATLIQEITLRITDVLTTISGRIEILSANAASPCREELLALRQVVMRGRNSTSACFEPRRNAGKNLAVENRDRFKGAS
jgi:hypothetical protein